MSSLSQEEGKGRRKKGRRSKEIFRTINMSYKREDGGRGMEFQQQLSLLPFVSLPPPLQRRREKANDLPNIAVGKKEMLPKERHIDKQKRKKYIIKYLYIFSKNL